MSVTVQSTRSTSKGNIAPITLAPGGAITYDQLLPGLVREYITSLSTDSITGGMIQINFASVLNWKSVGLRYSWRPFWDNTHGDFGAPNQGHIEGSCPSFIIANPSTNYARYIGLTRSQFENYFSTAEHGINVYPLVVQGSCPFEVNFNDVLEAVFFAGQVSYTNIGKLILQFTDFDVPLFSETSALGLSLTT